MWIRVLSTLAPPRAMEGLAAGEHRPAEHLPCPWFTDPQGPAAVAGEGPGWLASGPVDPLGPACLSLWRGFWVNNRVDLADLSMKFKRISKMIFQNSI